VKTVSQGVTVFDIGFVLKI